MNGGKEGREGRSLMLYGSLFQTMQKKKKKKNLPVDFAVTEGIGNRRVGGTKLSRRNINLENVGEVLRTSASGTVCRRGKTWSGIDDLMIIGLLYFGYRSIILHLHIV